LKRGLASSRYETDAGAHRSVSEKLLFDFEKMRATGCHRRGVFRERRWFSAPDVVGESTGKQGWSSRGFAATKLFEPPSSYVQTPFAN